MASTTSASGLILRCYSEQQRDGQWYAHCIDLTLDGQASEQALAVNKLNTAIRLYLEWAADRGIPPSEVLRPSPLHFQFRYRVSRIRRALGRLRRSGGRASGSTTFEIRPTFSL